MRRLVLWLLAGAALAAEPGFDEVFDPSKFPEGQSRTDARHAAFERALAARGAGAALAGFRGCERAIAELRERLDDDYERYRKLAAQWWGWRRKYEADYQRKHGVPPAEYPIPQGLNKSFLDSEKAFRQSRSMLLQERLFHEWAFERTRAALAADDRRKAVARGLSDRSPEQRLRCARLADGETAAAAAAKESDPGVLAALAEAAPSEALLNSAYWPVQAGAIRGAARLGSREAAAWLVGKLHGVIPGRLTDDLVDALRRMSGEDIGYDPARWKAWLEGLPADWHAKGGGTGEGPKGPLDEPKAEGVFSVGQVSFFGIESSARELVYCVQASAAWEQVRGELVRSIGCLQADTLFGVVVYDSEAHTFKSRLVDASRGNRDALAAWLEKLKPDRGADTYAGLEAALDLAGRKSKVPAADTIFLAAVTRPPEGTLFEDPRQVMLEITAENALLGIRIHCVGPSDGGESFYLQHLANQFDGTHVNG